MAAWDAAQYLKFFHQRTRPSRDLAAAIPLEAAGRILDAGCGPGNSTAVLAERFPEAQLLGIDLSEDMLSAAKERLPQAVFMQKNLEGDLTDLGTFDVVFSNAALQWLANPEDGIRRLFHLVAPGGCLAVQIPDCQPKSDGSTGRLETGDAHAAIWNTAAEPEFETYLSEIQPLKSVNGGQLYRLFADMGVEPVLWETLYCHMLDGYAGLIDWYKGTALRPYLEALPSENDRQIFCRKVAGCLEPRFPLEPDGRLLLWFRRLFLIAVRPAAGEKASL